MENKKLIFLLNNTNVLQEAVEKQFLKKHRVASLLIFHI